MSPPSLVPVQVHRQGGGQEEQGQVIGGGGGRAERAEPSYVIVIIKSFKKPFDYQYS